LRASAGLSFCGLKAGPPSRDQLPPQRVGTVRGSMMKTRLLATLAVAGALGCGTANAATVYSNATTPGDSDRLTLGGVDERPKLILSSERSHGEHVHSSIG